MLRFWPMDRFEMFFPHSLSYKDMVTWIFLLITKCMFLLQCFLPFYQVDLGVSAVKSTQSTWPLQVKSSRFNSKSPPKFSTQVAAEFQDKSHDSRSKYSVNLQQTACITQSYWLNQSVHVSDGQLSSVLYLLLMM